MKGKTERGRVRNLVVILGDQLDETSPAFDGFDPRHDRIWMAEVSEESTHVWSHRTRIALFLSAMRHFRDAQRALGRTVEYRELGAKDNRGTLSAELAWAVERLRPERVIRVEAGEWRVEKALGEVLSAAGVPVEVREDRHFLCSRKEFAAHAGGRRQLRMEVFYRWMRRRHGVLMGEDGEPVGGRWNFDEENRKSFGAEGPAGLEVPRSFPPDAVTREVLSEVARRFPGHPGGLERFDWPVTRAQAREALADFVAHRLERFGPQQDAMWVGSGAVRDAYLAHSRLSAAMNLKLLDPREVIAAAEAAHRAGRAPLESVEGFIRQVLGWREYVRGIYWQFMPGYADSNALGAVEPLPGFYWTGRTDMRCLATVVGQTLEFGYAHHIQRLMVTGLFPLLLGVRPGEVHAWYLAVYVDAVEWVELPNTIGMSQHADGGVMASKPYIASGKYLQRMGNYCAGCRYDPAESTGPRACPFTTLYWDFLARHEALLSKNPRMGMQLRNLGRWSGPKRAAVARQAAEIRQRLRSGCEQTVAPAGPDETPELGI